MKYNDYVYEVNVLNTYNYNISLRINITSEIKENEIFKMILENAVKTINGYNLHRKDEEQDINFKFILLF